MAPDDIKPHLSTKDEIVSDLRRIQQEAYARYLQSKADRTARKKQADSKPTVSSQPEELDVFGAHAMMDKLERDSTHDDSLDVMQDDSFLDLFRPRNLLTPDIINSITLTPNQLKDNLSDKYQLSKLILDKSEAEKLETDKPKPDKPQIDHADLINRRQLAPKDFAPITTKPYISTPSPTSSSMPASPTAHPEAREQQDQPQDQRDDDDARDKYFERVLKRNDLVCTSYLLRGYQASKSVCRIEVREGGFFGYGTGFLVAPDILITNNHVIPNKKRATQALARFDYHVDAKDKRCEGHAFEFNPDKFFLTDKNLDFTLVALQPESIDKKLLKKYPPIKLSPHKENVYVNDCLSIIQHPQGYFKSVALRENELLQFAGEDFIHYLTDTEPGSSGSPVFDDKWKPVALHHSGIPDPETKGGWLANEGIRISSIAAFVKDVYDKTTDPDQKDIMKGIFKW